MTSAYTSKRATSHPRRKHRQDLAAVRQAEAEASGKTVAERAAERGFRHTPKDER